MVKNSEEAVLIAGQAILEFQRSDLFPSSKTIPIEAITKIDEGAEGVI